jgi:glycosyltransferase involved in cell wall biosynthesis
MVTNIRMRIAHVIPAGAPLYSGVPRVIHQLAVHLARRGHEVEVWFLQPELRDAALVDTHLMAEAGVQVVRSADGWWPGLGGLAKRDVQLVHLHSVFTLPNAILAASLRMPYVISPHGGYAAASLTRHGLRKRLFAQLVERRLLCNAALRVALTDTEAADIQAFGARGPIAVIPNGVAEVPGSLDPSAFRRELGLAPGIPLLLFVGRLDVFHKGLDILLCGLAEAAPWQLALVGPDFRNGAAWIWQRAAVLGIQPRVHLVGPRSDRALHEAFAAADCFVLTSRWEGLPLSLLEALAHGIPAIVSPAVNRLVGVVESGAGWSVARADLGALLRSLEEGFAGESGRRGAAARALAARYDWRAIAQRYENAYSTAIAEHNRCSPC